ncbi:hypothetical protein E2C01_012277 [Portunus trituberculatus]|uniref:Uncharacterized protein n=1 Tax=Portunus trituberculatus TaxID=210409 RepID=A0A5B7DDM6_PORTR|nr:hypothetical protein [Portunus trituberculatus]
MEPRQPEAVPASVTLEPAGPGATLLGITSLSTTSLTLTLSPSEEEPRSSWVRFHPSHGSRDGRQKQRSTVRMYHQISDEAPHRAANTAYVAITHDPLNRGQAKQR